MDIIKQDIQFGVDNELQLKPILEKHFATTLTKTTDKYCPWDFDDLNGVKYEIKTRRCYSFTYPTTIIGKDKLRNNTIFVFAFTDGAYFIRYDSALFDTFSQKDISYNRGSQGKISPKLHIEIPIRYLTHIG